MKLGRIDVLYGSMKWPKFEVAVTSRGLSSSVSIFGLEAIKSYFQRLYLPCFSRYLKNSNALFFTTPKTPILFLQLFWSEAVLIPTLWPLNFDLDYLKTRILRFFPYFYKRKSQIYKVRCKRNFFGVLLVKGTIVDWPQLVKAVSRPNLYLLWLLADLNFLKLKMLGMKNEMGLILWLFSFRGQIEAVTKLRPFRGRTYISYDNWPIWFF